MNGGAPGPRAVRPAVAATLALLVAVGDAAGAELSFDRIYVDLAYGGNGRPGWVRSGDMDGDGDLDIVAGGGNALFIYENDGSAAGWTRHGDLDSTGAIGANGAVLFDVDVDGDLDVVCARYTSDLGWWENPGGALAGSPWAFHKISTETRYLHDIILADLDGDGAAEELVANLNEGYWSSRITIKWFTRGDPVTGLWTGHFVEADRPEGAPHGHAGLDTGDVDRDGHVDLAYANGWYEAPDEPTGSWTWRQLSTVYGVSNALLRDMDQDGRLDLVVSAGHHGAGIFWYEAPDDPIAGGWTQHTVDAVVHHPECLAVLDLYGDGDPDIVSCDLFFGEAPGEPGWDEQVHNVYVYENLGDATSWTRHSIAPDSYPSHLLQMVDVNADGRTDVLSEATGTSVVTYYENTTPGRVCQDDLSEPDDECPQAVGLAAEVAREHALCDEDWLELTVAAGSTYELRTLDLTGGADTVVEIYGATCGDFITEDDDSGPGAASLVTWVATHSGTSRARVRAPAYGAGRSYRVLYECIRDCGQCAAPQHLSLGTETVTGTEVREACSTITVEGDFTVARSADLTLRAGDAIVLGEGLVAAGSLQLELDRSLR